MLLQIINSNYYLYPFRFISNQTDNVKGISESSRSKRRNRNLVTMKFNMINWMVETVSILLVVIIPSNHVFIIYGLLNGCATPLVYIFGMEENRKSAKTTIMAMVLLKKPNQQKCNSTKVMGPPLAQGLYLS